MERLSLNSICDIVYRLRRGQSERAIAKDMGHSRHMVRHYHCLAREKGYLDAQLTRIIHERCAGLSGGGGSSLWSAIFGLSGPLLLRYVYHKEQASLCPRIFAF